MAFSGETADSYYDEGLTASIHGDLAAAASHFEKAIHLDNSMGPAYHQLGKCYTRMGRSDVAVHLLQEVIKKRPKMVGALVDLGHAYLGSGNLIYARESFGQALAVNPGNAKAMLGLAQAEFDEGNWAAAMRHAQQVLNESDSGFAVLYMVGRAAKLAGEAQLSAKMLVQADKKLEQYLDVNSDKPEGHFLRGELAFFRENFAAALDHYRESERNAQPDRGYAAFGASFSLVDMLAKQGLCLQRLGQFESARAVGNRIMDIDPAHVLGNSLVDSGSVG